MDASLETSSDFAHASHVCWYLLDVLAIYAATIWTFGSIIIVRIVIDSYSMSTIVVVIMLALCPLKITLAISAFWPKFRKPVAWFALRTLSLGVVVLFTEMKMSLVYKKPETLAFTAIFCEIWLVLGLVCFIYLLRGGYLAGAHARLPLRRFLHSGADYGSVTTGENDEEHANPQA